MATFREKYLDHDELTAQVKAWAAAHPDIVRLTSLTKTAGGRDQWLLTIGPDPDEVRPAVWVDGNMHASELAGSSVALGIAEDVIRLHTEPDADLHGLPAHLRGFLRGVKFFILPRMSPDGAEEVLTRGGWVRSVPRVGRDGRTKPWWRTADVDGDGLAMHMRIEDAAGEYVESKEAANLMVPRAIDDPPPYYRVYTEGFIEAWDGRSMPDPHYLDDNYPDLNRNFPFDWAPEHEQAGAGEFPGSEPESRSVMEFAVAHPEIAAWVDFHCFGGVFIRPRGEVPDNKMDPEDLAIYRQLGAWAEEMTGYPMVSGFEEFTYSPDTPIRGDLIEWAHRNRGAISYVCELWDLWAQLGHERPKRFVDHYSRLGRKELVGFAKWDREHNEGRVIRPWKKAAHPQLGEVEVGGLDSRVGGWNPPYEMLGEVCEKQSAMCMRLAAMVPRISLEVVVTAADDGGPRVVRATVRNLGYLPTYVTREGKALAHNEGLWADVEGEGLEVLAPVGGRVDVGHLEGWGRGLYGGDAAVHFVRSRGTTDRRELSWTVTGTGPFRVRVGSARTGWVEETIEMR
ncbi:MAG: peptidase M14 [Deltaproteobacteria bacterium]|nr:peptidase M14 [Deltaproteobacteria bacterium]